MAKIGKQTKYIATGIVGVLGCLVIAVLLQTDKANRLATVDSQVATTLMITNAADETQTTSSTTMASIDRETTSIAVSTNNSSTSVTTSQPEETNNLQPKAVYGSTKKGSNATSGCTFSITKNIAQSLREAPANSVGCVASGNYENEGIIEITSDGATLRAHADVTVQGFAVKADGVTLDGFFVRGSDGVPAAIGIEGNSVTVNNTYIDAPKTRVGIGCVTRTNCSDLVVKNNTITNVESLAVEVYGANALIERNNIFGLRRTSSGYDVDAIRFFGSGHRIVNNYIHDINEFQSMRGNDGDTPHVDCFQTFTTYEKYNPDVNPISTFDVVIENNYCVRVSRQCLILENNKTDQKLVYDITFRNNVCEVYDSQIINLKGVEDVLVENNYLGGNPAFHIVNFATSGASGTKPNRNVTVRNNIMQHEGSAQLTSGTNEGGNIADNTERKTQSSITRSGEFQTNTAVVYKEFEDSDFYEFRDLGARISE